MCVGACTLPLLYPSAGGRLRGSRDGPVLRLLHAHRSTSLVTRGSRTSNGICCAPSVDDKTIARRVARRGAVAAASPYPPRGQVRPSPSRCSLSKRPSLPKSCFKLPVLSTSCIYSRVCEGAFLILKKHLRPLSAPYRI